MSAQRINEKHSSWMLPVVLVNICLGVEFDVLAAPTRWGDPGVCYS